MACQRSMLFRSLNQLLVFHAVDGLVAVIPTVLWPFVQKRDDHSDLRFKYRNVGLWDRECSGFFLARLLQSFGIVPFGIPGGVFASFTGDMGVGCVSNNAGRRSQSNGGCPPRALLSQYASEWKERQAWLSSSQSRLPTFGGPSSPYPDMAVPGDVWRCRRRQSSFHAPGELGGLCKFT